MALYHLRAAATILMLERFFALLDIERLRLSNWFSAVSQQLDARAMVDTRLSYAISGHITSTGIMFSLLHGAGSSLEEAA